ncbi:PilC/PilY family type IV pilus protein [Acinetobacter sp. YH01020]|uniref:PilC/PilY family type IV pilus protein n=1 Tax=Acinetobacter sp. YH01020 TaxID=2601034 RepID=UPI0015D119F6|nr:PilC/PilY family type IV pilus protein [Acinetobacter sp. YH01020]
MNMKYKKLVIAIQSAMMTSLICSALPSHASDIELYKGPQASQTTLMFMMDVSGSMDTKDDGVTTRLDHLKNGMKALLLGTSTTEALPDRLVVGLSEFSSIDATGKLARIKLEARPLNEMTTIPNAQVFREVQKQTGNSEQSYTKVTRKGEYRDRNSGNWSTLVEQQFSISEGSVSTSNLIATGTKQFEECIDWNTNKTCKDNGWVATTKRLNDFGTVTSNTVNGNTSYSWASSNDGVGTPISNNSTTYPLTFSECIETGWFGRCNKIRYYQKLVYTSYSGKKLGTVTQTEYKVYSGTAEDTHRKKMIRAVNALSSGGGTPTAYAFAEVAAYLMGETTLGQNGSGFVANVNNISGSSAYTKPTALNSQGIRENTIDRTKQCNTQGIYFLTDGLPTYYDYTYNDTQYLQSTMQSFMKKSLGTKGDNFLCTNDSTLGKYTSGSYSYDSKSNGGSRMLHPNGWNCIGAYTKALLNPDLNPVGAKIKTAVVGFGNDFSSGNGGDIKDAKNWGNLGEGGWYSGTNDAAVVGSVLEFLKKLQKYIPPVTTGSVTIPVDNLDTQNIQPWGYFPQFDPQPDSKVNTWIGNLKKYEVKNNVLLDRDGKNIIDSTTQISVDDPNDFWSDNSIKKTITKIKRVGTADIEEDIEVRVGGALSQFKLGVVDSNERKIFTDRKIDAQGVGSTIANGANLVQVKTADLKTLNASNNFSKDPQRGYIAALFGYDVGATMAKTLETDTSTATQTNFANYLTQSNATLRQMGAVMHSKPVLITQSGTTTYNDETGDLTYTDRDDLIVFGTTQGLLHIVRAGKTRTDSNAGKEVFTFMPNEMVENQSQGFLNQTQQGTTLNYGIDGQWTAYTEYVTKSTSTAYEPEVTVKGGKQWLYGGLRMGGRSYYALDLSDVTSGGGTPKLKFKIEPETSTDSAIRYMGQSWSKPTLTWVNWQGERKLVMLVGGGYDKDMYESNINYSPSSSIDKGAGVYMFDADDGSLLWWSSANVGSNSTQNNATYAENMKRSVVSQIKAIDRNNDGLADHLYFGDLGGQVWRVDLNASSKAGDTENFAKRAVRILDMSTAAKVPRFYSTPTFTIHNSVNGYFGVLTIGSGNLSFPMSAENQNDALYVVYDKDVTKRNLSVLKASELSTVDVSTTGQGGKLLVANANGNTGVPLSNGGWYYTLPSKNRILNDNVAIDNDLYISVFNSNIDISDVDCVGGVRGKSIAQQYCLPFGQCLKKNPSGNSEPEDRPDDIELGRGNIGISFGGIDKKRGLVLNLPTDKTLKSYQGKTKFISQRWYER